MSGTELICNKNNFFVAISTGKKLNWQHSHHNSINFCCNKITKKSLD